ncbi:hypothetical protein CAEBREN_23356 [Caenorhabditis brenneri]|uniref:Uncharacterized protein n=1 Tax=Caenorhabditis brenneri TaxID=135651 RepID=G0MP83_CAEBE|nr:hypothetical protein CAEBREN_23356 [Caenorhabditis brenneri]
MPKSNPVTPNKQPPTDYSELIVEFVQKAGRGLPKTFIKKLWAVEEDLLENANLSILRMMYCSPALMACKEGIKLLALILDKIGVRNGLTLLEKQILKSDLTDTDCQRYGDVFATTWLNAHSDANFDLTEELETDVYHVFFQHALFGQKPLCAKFQKVLSAFAAQRKENPDFAIMISGMLNGCIYRALDSKNSAVQTSGMEVFFMFFPFVEADPAESDQLMDQQLRYMFELVKSDIVHIRTESLKHTLRAISEYWVLLNKDIVKKIGSYIIDVLAKDSVVGVRVAGEMPKSNPVTPNKQPPTDYSELIVEFVQKAGRGLPKTFIKKLWAVEEDLLENANLSILRMMYCSPALMVCKEGIKLLALILDKIGVRNGLTLLEKQILKSDLTDTDCQRYGDVFATTWLNAHSDANFDLTEELETDVFHVFFQHALFGQKPLCAKFQKVLSAFAAQRKENPDFAMMISGMLNGCIYRALDSNNSAVQTSGMEVFFMFFPFVEADPAESDQLMDQQLRYMFELVKSDIVHIRTESLKHTLRAISEYWVLLNKDIVKKIGSYIIDVLAKDSVVGVRVADRDDVLSIMELENVEDCRRQIVPIMHMLLPISRNMDEKYYKPRIDSLLAGSRLATLTYFRLLGPMKLIDGEQAAELVQMMITWAYRFLRLKDSKPVAERDPKYRKARAYLECALIVYMSCKKMLLCDCDPIVKGKCDQLFGKVVKEIFEHYSKTPILGTATAISSVIPKDNLKSIASNVLCGLADDDVPEEAVEPYLESALHFNPDSVFDSINNGLEVLTDLCGEKQKQTKKKKRDVGSPEEVLRTSLSRLTYVISSHSTSSLLATDDLYKTKILDMVKKIDSVRNVIEKRFDKVAMSEEYSLPDDILLLALEFRFILPLYAVSENNEDEEERRSIISSIKQLLNWFQEKIVIKMSNVEENNREFVIKLSVTVLDCLNIALSAYDFKTRPLEYEDEEDEENQSPEEKQKQEEEEETVADVASEIVTSFFNSETPIEVLAAALRIGATLCEDLYSETHYSMAALLRFIPKWMNLQCDPDAEPLDEQQEKYFMDALRQFYKRVCETDAWTDEISAKMFYHYVVFAFVSVSETYEDKESDDPRLEDYEPPRFISFALLKFILKDKQLTEGFLNEILEDYLPEDSKFFTADGELTTEQKLSKLTLLSHILRILERYSKTHDRKIKEAIQTCATRVSDCFASAKDLDTVPHHVINSLSSLLDVDLPDDP